MNGADAEAAALQMLQRKGLRLLARNVRYRGGELDLVMRDGETLVFVEVRARTSFGFASAAESVDARKRAKLVLAAQLYLADHPKEAERVTRFDVFTFDDGQPRWIRNAFDGY